jgi:putative transposase
LFKSEVIHHRGLWRNLEQVEYATLEWVDWFNNRRLLEPIGNIPPAEFELIIIASKTSRPPRPDSTKTVSENPGAIQA